MSIYEKKQYSKNILYSKEVMNDLHKRAKNAGYSLFKTIRKYDPISFRGGYRDFQEEIWFNEENCVHIHYAQWYWGSDHPERYEFDGHILTDDEMWGRVPPYRPAI